MTSCPTCPSPMSWSSWTRTRARSSRRMPTPMRWAAPSSHRPECRRTGSRSCRTPWPARWRIPSWLSWPSARTGPSPLRRVRRWLRSPPPSSTPRSATRTWSSSPTAADRFAHDGDQKKPRKGPAMYGWRCRIGLVYPAVVAETLLTEFFRIVPDGVTMAMTQLSIGILHEDDIMRAASEMDRAIGYLAERHVDCIVAAGAPIIRRLGAGSDTDLIERAERETGIPTTTSQTAALDAFKALGVGRIAVASPYHEDQDERVRSFLETSGLEVATIDGMRKDVAEIHNISLGDAYHHAKRTYFRDPTAEAIYVPCGHFTVPDVPTLELSLIHI